jgi:hypothetical protein
MLPLDAFNQIVGHLDDLLVELFLGTETTKRQFVINNKLGERHSIQLPAAEQEVQGLNSVLSCTILCVAHHRRFSGMAGWDDGNRAGQLQDVVGRQNFAQFCSR